MVVYLENKRYTRWPNKLLKVLNKLENSKYCAFHKETGHNTKSYGALKFKDENLQREGYLKEF